MSDDFDFVPKLGRIRSQGKAKTQLKRLNRVVSMGRLGNKGRKSLKPGTLRNKGRGKAQAALVRHWSNQRARRVIVKVHIARSGPTGAASFGKHVAYIRRDGAGRDGERGKLYDRSREEADGKAFNERASDDSRQVDPLVGHHGARRAERIGQRSPMPQLSNSPRARRPVRRTHRGQRRGYTGSVSASPSLT